MITQHTPRPIVVLVILISALLISAPAATFAQAAPAQSPPRQGTILDISANTALEALHTRSITVDLDHQSPEEAADAMSVDGIWMDIHPNWAAKPEDRNSVTLHLRDAPYMEALMELRQQLHARVTYAPGSKVTLNYDPSEEIPPWCVAGPFAVVYQGISNEILLPVDFTSNATLPRAPTTHVNLHLNLLPEPGIYLLQSMRDVQCPNLQDDKHQPIGVKIISSPGGMASFLELTLPESPGRRIPLLKGTIDAKIAETSRVDLTNVTEKQTPPPVEGMTIEVSPLVAMNNSPLFFMMEIKFSRGDMDPQRWAKIAPLLPGATLTISGRGHGQISASISRPFGKPPIGDELRLQCHVTISHGAGPPGKATLDIPMDATDVRVPFVFKDVILP